MNGFRLRKRVAKEGIAMTLIKICGIADPDLAYLAARSGADFIGIVYHKASRRHVDSSILGYEISMAAKEGGARPVLVVKDCSSHVIVQTAYDFAVDIVQMHGKAQDLPETFARILANAAPNEAVRQQDFLLLDNEIPGSGLKLDWQKVEVPLRSRWMLSGGLTPENVAEGIQLLKPDGVDVSSGVERSGAKDQGLIQKFIGAVRGVNVKR